MTDLLSPLSPNVPADVPAAQRPVPCFSPAEKIAALKREIAMRKAVYPGRVKRDQMTQEAADHQIGVMTEILHDYLGRAP